jgi:hypothetical protein
MPEPLIPKYGGHRKLRSFQVAELVETMTTADSLRLTACSLGRTQRRKRAGAVSRGPRAGVREHRLPEEKLRIIEGEA